MYVCLYLCVFEFDVVLQDGLLDVCWYLCVSEFHVVLEDLLDYNLKLCRFENLCFRLLITAIFIIIYYNY